MNKLTNPPQLESSKSALNKSKRSTAAKQEFDSLELFPSTGYFQTHFEHIHDNHLTLRRELNHLCRQLAIIETRLDQILRANAPANGRCGTCSRPIS